MSTHRRLSIVMTAGICVAFGLAFAVMIVAAKADHNAFDQLVLVNVGSALLGAGLVVVLVHVFMIVADLPGERQR